MKIGFLVYNQNKNAGWGRQANDLISGIKDSGYEVVVLNEAPDDTGSHVCIKRGWKMFFSVPIVVWKLRDCDIIHALDLNPYGLVAFMVNFFLKKKLVISGIGTYTLSPLYSGKISWLAKNALKGADYFVPISKYTKEEVKKILPNIKSKIIPPSIDLSYFEKNTTKNNKFPLPGDFYIISVGQLKPRKGQDVTIRALKIVKNKFPNLKCVFVGNQKEVSYFNYLKQIVAKNNLSDSVHFKQGISDEELADLYANAQLFVMPSVNDKYHYEGFGIVFLEAAFFKLPVIGTRNNGISDAINEGVNGLLVEQKNHIDLAEAIIRILSSRSLKNDMSVASKDWVKKFDKKNIVKEFISLYESLLI